MQKKLHSLLPSSQFFLQGQGDGGGAGPYSGDIKTTFALPFTLVHFKGIKFLLIDALQVKMAKPNYWDTISIQKVSCSKDPQ
jgi:hypothetical protein